MNDDGVFSWWQQGVIYQIYPRSFQDSNDDGVGDLNGIASRLDYLVDLGVDAVWLSPVFTSPMADFGYDVADFCGIDPVFGSLDDFDALVNAMHARGLKLILDYVPNHTSDRHPWFLQSRSSRTHPKRNWYVWRDAGPNGAAPSNWLSEFGGPAWTWDDLTSQYYYHAYLQQQPDLNWRHDAVRSAMLQVLQFWLDRGVDGFRVDAIHHLFEDPDCRDNPPNPDWTERMSPARRLIRDRTMDQPEVHDAVAAMRKVADRYSDRILIGEAYLPIARLMAYYGVDLLGFHMPFNFHLIAARWQPKTIADLIAAYEAALPPGAWPNWVLGNHDRSRLASRIGREQARVAAMLLLTLRGTPTIYQGEELGMRDVAIPADEVKDPWEKNAPGLGLGRDPVRTPMPWNGRMHRGFTRGVPWLRLGTNDVANACAQSTDPASMLSLYRALLRLRRCEPALSVGSYVSRSTTDSVLIYERRHANRRLLVALNFSDQPQTLDAEHAGRILLSTCPDAHAHAVNRLAPHEGRVMELASE
jgi:alpha-glucosidase